MLFQANLNMIILMVIKLISSIGEFCRRKNQNFKTKNWIKENRRNESTKLYQNSSFKAVCPEHTQYGWLEITKFLTTIIRKEFGHDSWKVNITYHSLNNLLDEQGEQSPQDISAVRFRDFPSAFPSVLFQVWNRWSGKHLNIIFPFRRPLINIWIQQRVTKPCWIYMQVRPKPTKTFRTSLHGYSALKTTHRVYL